MNDEPSHVLGILAEISDRNGSLTPKIVVAEARNEKHPLHSRFEWDDSIAGERFRITQASQLIRSVMVKVVTRSAPGPVEVRAFWPKRYVEPDDDAREVEDRPDGRSAYVQTATMTPVQLERIGIQIQRDVASLRRKYARWDDLLQTVIDQEFAYAGEAEA